MENDKNIDDLFKRVLEDPADQPVYRENDWDNLEQLLDKGKRPTIIYWLPVLTSAAAILLIFFGWWMLRPEVADQSQKLSKIAVESTKPIVQQQNASGHTGIDKKQNSQVAVNAKPAKVPASNTPTNKYETNYMAGNDPAGKKEQKNTVLINRPDHIARRNNVLVNQAIIQNDGVNSNTRDNIVLGNAAQRVNIMPSASTMPTIASVNILPKDDINSSANTEASKSAKATIKKRGFTLPQLTLSVLASSDLNGISSFQNATAGHNYGMLLSVTVLKKFTITSGVNYSVKPYTVPFENYHTTYKFKNSPQSVAADCRMLDIPVNIDYQLYNNHKNKITIGSGLSSYLMKHESYTYNYADQSVVYGPSYYDVKKPGKYMFSVLNFQASYQRQINSKIGISIQPYLKLPLSNIGYSQIKLQTAGVAVGLNWNINSIIKPK